MASPATAVGAGEGPVEEVEGESSEVERAAAEEDAEEEEVEEEEKAEGEGSTEIEAINVYLAGLYEETAANAEKERAKEEEEQELASLTTKATMETEGEGEGEGDGEGEGNSELATDIPKELLGETPDSRPVTAPSGAFEFDLNKGSWEESGLLLSDYHASGGVGGGGGKGDASLGEASSAAIDEMKRTLTRKDKQIETLLREVERLQGNGSVVSDLTAL